MNWGQSLADERKEDNGTPVTQGGRPRDGAADAYVAQALRSAYEEAVREDIPSEFLDLLDKLS